MSRYHISKTNRRLSFEWALIANETDTPQAAHDLGRLISGVHIILPTPTATATCCTNHAAPVPIHSVIIGDDNINLLRNAVPRQFDSSKCHWGVQRSAHLK
jgi:hypothetical protein